MFKRVLLAALTGLLVLWQPVNAQEVERPLLLAHYMPWYQTPEVSGYWGWHWTMDHFDPSLEDANGRPEFASHMLPLTGLYDSQDDKVLEYQVLLMKLSGIDGVIVDWYGIEDFQDYAVLNASMVKLFEYVKRAGLKFVICYEDRSIRQMVAQGYIEADAAYARAQEDMHYLRDNWFGDESYLKYNDQPMLFVFGPQYFRTPQDWEMLFAEMEATPALVTLDGHMDWAALSSFPWPPMNMAGGITMAPAVLDAYLELFYRNARRKDFVVGSAFPGFHDIYEEADIRSSFGYIDPQQGETLKRTLEIALAHEPDIVQLVTWNDYGEGTAIEPTEEFGYQYLEIVQDTRRSFDEAYFSFTADDLRLPLQLFHLRQTHPGDGEIQSRLDRVFNAIVVGDVSMATDILAAFE